MTAKVYASNGQPVNMREKPSKSSSSLLKVPVGSIVTVEMQDPEWSLIVYKGVAGYMMTSFLQFESDEDDEYISVKRSVLEDIVNSLEDIIGRG